MHVALLAPFSKGPIRGNIVTVNRIARHLALQGMRSDIIPLDNNDEQPICDRMTKADHPALLHAFHAYYSGPSARAIAQKLGIPYIITITGSDLFDPYFRDQADTALALYDAAAITCFDNNVGSHFKAAFPDFSDKIFIIPQGVEPLPAAQPIPRPDHTFIVLLPAALRPAKGVMEAINALAPLASDLPELQLWLAGGNLDADYATLVRRTAADKNWIRLLGEVPHEQMGEIYQACDLVLNSSLFEGGMANSLLEAMACAKAVLAADIPGNRSLIKLGETGFIYLDNTDLRRQIRLLTKQPDQLLAVGRAACEQILSHFSAEQEACSLIRLYTQLTS